MNQAILAMMPKVIGTSTQQVNQSTAQSTAKFDDILNSTLVNNSKVAKTNSINSDLTMEQKKVMEDLLAFLELEDGNLIDENFGEINAFLQALMKVHGEDASAATESLTDILHNGLALKERDSVNNQDENQDVNSVYLQELTILNSLEIEDMDKLGLGVTELQGNQDEDQDVNQLLLEVTPNLYDILTRLNTLETEELVKLDMNGMVNILKLVKLQDIQSSHQELSQDAALFQKEIQNLLDSISGKLEKWLGIQPAKAGHETTAAILLENKTLDVVTKVYARMFNAEGEKHDESISNGLTLKAAESNPQSSGFPFQMTKLEQYVLTASKNGQTVDVEQFVKSFENILSKAHFSNANGTQKLLIRLNPEHLGSLRIELIQKDGAITAKILATTAQAKDLLNRQVQGLKQAFTNQNIQVEKIEISQQISTFNVERFVSRDQGQSEQRQRQSQHHEQNDEEENDFTDRFTEALLNVEV